MSSPEVCWPVPMRAIGAQNLLTMPGGVSAAGYLHKKGGNQFSLMRWPLRYIIIHKGCVYYFKSSTSPVPQGAFSLNGYNRVMRAAEETTSNNVFPFKIVHFSKKHRTWFFSAASEEERKNWMRTLRREIDHYNERNDTHIPSDSDSDDDNFYGSVEAPMDIRQPVDNTDDDYGEDDDDEDEEDYLKPDGDIGATTSAGRPTGPPPSYPPPPVPLGFQRHQESCPVLHKGPPPPVPSHSRVPTSPHPKKNLHSAPLPSILKDPNKGPPPPLPFAPHLHGHQSPTAPPPPPPNLKRTPPSRAASVAGYGTDTREWKPPPAAAVHTPTTLPICDQLEARLGLNGRAHRPLNAGGFSSLSNNQHSGITKPSLSVPHPAVTSASIHKPGTPPCRPPPPCQPPFSPQLNTGSQQNPVIPKSPTPAVRPVKLPGAPLQRATPDGQSFRSLRDEMLTEFSKLRKPNSAKHPDDVDSDEDYENMQLPESVFIDTTETSFVEKLFRESSIVPQDGLYGIRKSGTKTSQVLVVWDVSIGKARNYRLFQEDARVFLDCDVTFPTLSALVEHYYNHPLPHHGSLCLQKPYTKTPMDA
ncbi:SH3 domain-binding protein 2 [Aulostomus maculatus]